VRTPLLGLALLEQSRIQALPSAQPIPWSWQVPPFVVFNDRCIIQ
jgi:hypothetical protein